MHHHMLEMLRARFPDARELDGWTKEEIAQAVETGVLEGVRLSKGHRQALATLNDMGEIARVERDDDDVLAHSDFLGYFIESGNGYWGRHGEPGVHNHLHRSMADENDPVDMMNMRRNLMNKTFWKLHGFIDRAWREFLEARGTVVPRDALDYQAEMMQLLSDPQSAHGLDQIQWLMPERADW
jgi:hypothetical protein